MGICIPNIERKDGEIDEWIAEAEFYANLGTGCITPQRGEFYSMAEKTGLSR